MNNNEKLLITLINSYLETLKDVIRIKCKK